MKGISELAALIADHTPSDGEHATAIPRVELLRSSAGTEPFHTLYKPSCCIVAQGRKQARVGQKTYVYDPNHYLVAGIDLPATGAVVDASVQTPCLCLRLELDPQVIGQLIESGVTERTPAAGMALSDATPEIVDACVRLLRLLDTPQDVAALAPLMERELLYRLLRGPQGAVLRAIATGNSQLRRIGRAVEYIKQHYREAVTVKDLAAIAGNERLILPRTLSLRDGNDGTAAANTDQTPGGASSDAHRRHKRRRGCISGRLQQSVSVQP